MFICAEGYGGSVRLIFCPMGVQLTTNHMAVDLTTPHESRDDETNTYATRI